MPIKILKPVTPSLRNTIRIQNKLDFNQPLLKSHSKGFKKTGGRNNTGRITSAHIGGGHKRKYRKINFYRKNNSVGVISSIEYDPNRNCYIAAVFDIHKYNYFYIIAPRNLKIGDIVKSGPQAQPKIGHALSISQVPTGSLIHNISAKSLEKSTISRAAGTYSVLIEKTLKNGRIKISSGEQRLISSNCTVTIGVVSNELFFLTTKGKAGRSRWLNKRPKVRGVAMNPIDHPHGGGEGKKSKKCLPVTPWGKPTKGGSTRKKINKLTILLKK